MLDVAVKRWKRNQTLADLRTARICSILTSTKAKQHPPSEFMIEYDEKPKAHKRQSAEEMAAILKEITILAGGTVNG